MGTVSGDLGDYFMNEIIPVWKSQHQSEILDDGTEVACSETCGPLVRFMRMVLHIYTLQNILMFW